MEGILAEVVAQAVGAAAVVGARARAEVRQACCLHREQAYVIASGQETSNCCDAVDK